MNTNRHQFPSGNLSRITRQYKGFQALKKFDFIHHPGSDNPAKPMSAISIIEEKQARRAWNASEGKWLFVIDAIVHALNDSANVRDYIKKLWKRDSELDSYWGTNCPPVEMIASRRENRLNDEGNETVTNCHGLKMSAPDGNSA